MYSCMPTTAVARTKAAMFCGTYCGGSSQKDTRTSLSLFWWWATPSSPLIGASAFSSDCLRGPSLRGIAEVVQRSGKCNVAQLVVDKMEDVIVPTYDWVSFFASRFKKLPNIKKGHHFRLSSSHPGVVCTKERTDNTIDIQHDLLKEGATFDDPSKLPRVHHPSRPASTAAVVPVRKDTGILPCV